MIFLRHDNFSVTSFFLCVESTVIYGFAQVRRGSSCPSTFRRVTSPHEFMVVLPPLDLKQKDILVFVYYACVVRRAIGTRRFTTVVQYDDMRLAVCRHYSVDKTSPTYSKSSLCHISPLVNDFFSIFFSLLLAKYFIECFYFNDSNRWPQE